jgi:hypothetical protein
LLIQIEKNLLSSIAAFLSLISARTLRLQIVQQAQLCPAKRINGSLQCLHGGEPKGYRRGIEAAKRLGQR